MLVEPPIRTAFGRFGTDAKADDFILDVFPFHILVLSSCLVTQLIKQIKIGIFCLSLSANAEVQLRVRHVRTLVRPLPQITEKWQPHMRRPKIRERFVRERGAWRASFSCSKRVEESRGPAYSDEAVPKGQPLLRIYPLFFQLPQLRLSVAHMRYTVRSRRRCQSVLFR